jgi:NADH dehydrogenase
MSEEASAKAREFLEKMGVKIYNGVRVSAFDGELLTINNGETIRTRNVLWAAGVVGEVPEGIAKEVIQRGNQIETDDINKVKGYNNIFAIGDVAYLATTKYPEGLPGVAQVAIQQGKHLAKNIASIIEGRATEPFSYNDKGSMATIGKNKAVADIGRIKLQGFRAWLIWCFIHLISLVGFSNRLKIFINWLGKYFSYNTSTRLILRPFNRELMTEDPRAK